MYIIKRHGKKEKFDERKLYGSVYAAVLNAERSEKKAEMIAEGVCRMIKKKIGMKAITSENIKKEVIKLLKKYDKDVAFLYETHLDLS